MNRNDQIMVATREDSKPRRGNPDRSYSMASAYEGVDDEDDNESLARVKNVPAPRANDG